MNPQRPTDLVARIVTDEPGDTSAVPSRRTPRGKGRVVSSLLIAMLAGFLVFTGFSSTGSSTPAAQAIGPCVFKSENNPGPELYLAGTSTLFPVPDEEVNRPTTFYERHRMSGLVWSTYFPEDSDDSGDGQEGCWKFGQSASNMIANQVFEVNKVLTGATIAMYQWAASPDLLKGLNESMRCVIKGCDGADGLADTLFLNFLTPIIVLGALWGGWVGLMKKRTTEAAQGGIWMIGAATFALVFMANPVAIANGANSVVNTINTTVMAAVTNSTTSNVGKADICYLPDSVNANKAGPRIAACSMYKGMSYTPWAAGQFGVAADKRLSGPTTHTWNGREVNDARVSQIAAQSVSLVEHNAMDTGAKDWDTINADDDELWADIQAHMQDKHPEQYASWTGDRSGDRINIAFAAVIASVMAGLLVIIIAFSTVVMAIGMIMLIMMAPLFLLIGVHPGVGRGIALKWLELLIGTVVKRIVLGFMLAILIGMYQVIMSTSMAWFSQIALILAIGVGAIMFRKPLLDTLNVVNLGGTRTGMEQANLTRQAKKGGATGIGALTGGVSGAKSGGAGAFMTGMVAGGMMGMRSGNPMRAATMGTGAGRRVGGRKKASKVAEARAEAKTLAAERDQHYLDEQDLPADLEERIAAHADKNGEAAPIPRPSKEAAAARKKRLREQEQEQGGTPEGRTPAPDAPAGAGGAPVAPVTDSDGGEGWDPRAPRRRGVSGGTGAPPRPGAGASTAAAGSATETTTEMAPVTTASGSNGVPTAPPRPHPTEPPAPSGDLLTDIKDVLDHQQQMVKDLSEDVGRDLGYLGFDLGHTIEAVEDTKASLSAQMLENAKKAAQQGPKPPTGSNGGSNRGGSGGGGNPGGAGARPGGK